MSRYALTPDFENLLGVTIIERGENAMVRCPFHPDDRASLSLDLERGFWLCFGCGERGSIFSMAHKLEQELDTADILSRSSRADQDTRDDPADFRDKAYELHLRTRNEKPMQVVRYLVSRGISGKIIDKFRIGWDGNRIAMPYYDGDSVVAIKYRYANGFKAYETGSIHYLYNVNDVRTGAETAIICEGESDTHAVWSSLAKIHEPLYNVAVLGVPGVGEGLPSRRTWELWALELLHTKKVYIAFDADNAGDAGAELAMSVIGDRAIRMRPTKGNDMADHLMKGGTLVEAGVDESHIRIQ